MASVHRCRIEVFRFLSAADTLLSCSALSRSWCDSANCEEVWVNLCELYSIDPVTATRSVKEQFRIEALAGSVLSVLRPESISLFAVPSLEETQVALSTRIEVDQYTAYCFLKKGVLFACGGNCGYVRRETMKINTDTGDVTYLCPMSAPRHSHGLYKFSTSVYSFGGKVHTQVSLIERYSLLQNSWHTLPVSLSHPCEGLLPVRFKNCLYLVENQHINVFNLVNETIRSFPKSLPKSWHYCLPHITADGELIVVQKEFVVRFQLNSETAPSRKREIQIVKNGDYWSNCRPVQEGNSLYSLLNTHGTIIGILRFDTNDEKLEVVQWVQY